MDLQETINQLEKGAAQYTEAANSLRVLLNEEDAPASVVLTSEATSRRNESKGKKSDAKVANQPKKRAPMSAEARARIGAATRARHEAKKAAENSA